uniref:(northern house mosquito) hypothetical protein n=1 Tax=Culex pipiens TaxID=7175 RepID=A0A8D8CPS9_CULPI
MMVASHHCLSKSQQNLAYVLNIFANCGIRKRCEKRNSSLSLIGFCYFLSELISLHKKISGKIYTSGINPMIFEFTITRLYSTGHHDSMSKNSLNGDKCH